MASDSTPFADTNNTDFLEGAHILAFEYPAVDLLPKGIELDIPRPSQAEQRHKPHVNAVHPELGTEFFALLKADDLAQAGAPWVIPVSDTVNDLLATVGKLKGVPGSTTLHIVTFKHLNRANRTLIYRLWFENVDSVEEREFKPLLELNEEEWSSLPNHFAKHPWLHLLTDLVHRGSERAFFDVQNRLLQTFPVTTVTNEENRWVSLWASQPLRTAPDLFRSSLEPIGFGDSRDVIVFQLPCSHSFPIARAALGTLDAENSVNTQCPVCSAPIIQPEDYPELQARESIDATTSFHASNTLWRSLDKEDFATNRQAYIFETELLISILSHILTTFNVPASICPAELNPMNLYAEELEAIATHLKTTLRPNISAYVTCKPQKLYTTLHGLMMLTPLPRRPGRRIRDVAHPPGREEFLSAWFKRAMNFLVERRCVQTGWGHEGLHEHDEVLYYRAAALTGEEVERESEMEDLIGAFEKSGL